MKVTLEDLQEKINSEGVTDEYQNGANQKGIKQSATLQSYNSLIKNYASVMKSLSQLLPPEKKDVSQYGYKPTPKKTPEEIELEEMREREKQKQINEEIKRASEWQKQQRGNG